MVRHEVEQRGREASCRLLVHLFRDAGRRGVPPETLRAGLAHPESVLRDANQRIDWASFARVLENAGCAFRESELIAIGLAAAKAPVYRYVRVVARLLYSTRDLYFWGCGAHTGLIHQDYGCFQSAVIELGRNRLVIEITLRDGYPPSQEFFQIAHGMLSAYPTVLGLPPATVQREAIENGARYDITYAQGFGQLARLRKLFTWPFTVRAAAHELREAHALLQERLLDLTREVAWRRDADQELRRLATALEAAGEAIVITDVEGSIQYVNPQFEQQTGYSREEALGRNPKMLKSGFHDDAFYREMWTTLGQGQVWRGTLINKRKDGSFYDVEQTIAPVKDAGGTIISFVSVKRDITGRKQAEQTIAEQHVRMMAASRLAALGLMAGNIAHEIKNPLAVISGNAELIEEIREHAFPDHPPCGKAVTAILRNVERIEQIVRGLRNLSGEGGKDPFVATSLRNLVGDTLELCRPRFKPDNVDLSLALIPVDIHIECRPTQVSQVLLNLLNNALDAVLHLPDRWVRLEFADLGDAVELAVVDSGRGVSPAVRESIFDQFFTTKVPEKGTGLGLSISRGIIERHQGRLWLDTESPNTRFVVRLPKVQGAALPGQGA